MSISLCIIARNEAPFLHLPIHSVSSIISEIVVADDNSTDTTVEVAKRLGAKVINLPLPIKEEGFAFARNFLAKQATGEWILQLDADERLDEPERLVKLAAYNERGWLLPRRKWKNYSNLVRDEWDAYPDWQPRFYRNIPENMDKWKGRYHESLDIPMRRAYSGPHIEHLQEECRIGEKLIQRQDIYTKFSDSEGVSIHGGFVIPGRKKNNE